MIDGAVVGPNVSVEAGATVRNAVVRDSIVFQDGRVENSVLRDSIVGRHAITEQTVGSVNVGDHSEVG
jgi:glucose-1-phosphate thymidylyltransferase